MKKTIAILLTLVFVTLAFTACGENNTSTASSEATSAVSSTASSQAESTESETLTVGASSTPHAEILEQAKPLLEAQGYTLKIVVYDDYVLPNQALASGELDANYFQHTPYLESFNASNGTDLNPAASIHYEPFGIYGNEVDNLSDLEPGAKIIIPADDSNETRALLLLEQEGLITLPEGANAADGVTSLDIVDNGGYDVQTVQADTVPAQLNNSDDGTIAVINGNYALQAGLKVENALAIEDASGDAAQTYANVIAVRSEDVNKDKIKALISVLQSETIKVYIEETYDGAVISLS